MNPSRVTNADIDTDYCSKDRDKIKYFLLHDKMDLLDINPNIRTAEIITFNTVDTKGAVKDICRALYRKDKEDKEYLTISDFISKSIDAGREEDMRKQYPDSSVLQYPYVCDHGFYHLRDDIQKKVEHTVLDALDEVKDKIYQWEC
mgnify:CR=1 FL=1